MLMVPGTGRLMDVTVRRADRSSTDGTANRIAANARHMDSIFDCHVKV